MIQIRPVSDLRNKYPEMEKLLERGDPIYLTKNGHGVSVLLSLEEYERLQNDYADAKFNEAGIQAEGTVERYTLDEVVGEVLGRIHGEK